MDSLAITVALESRPERIITSVSARQAESFCKRYGLPETNFAAKALWDTGSTGCCIDAELAVKLGLKQYGTIGLNDSQGGHGLVSAYLIDIIFPDGASARTVTAAGVHTGGKFDIIIGMNIIALGDFALTRDKDKTVLSFRLPSSGKVVDFSKDGAANV
jgi:hypothetical protein